MKAILLCLTLAACRLYAQDTTLLSHLPQDASGIYQFNLPVLTTKLSWQELTAPIPVPQPNTYNRELALILRDPDRAGIDIHRPVYIIESDIITLLVHLNDSAHWSAFLRQEEPGIHITSGKLTPGQTPPNKISPSNTSPGKIIPDKQALCARRDRMGAAWNDQLAAITFTPPNYSAAALRRSLAILAGYDEKTRIHDSLFWASFSDDADIHAWTIPGHTLSLLLHQLFPGDHDRSASSGSSPSAGSSSSSGPSSSSSTPLPSRPSPSSTNSPQSHNSPADGPQSHVLSSLRFEKGRILLNTSMPLTPAAAQAYLQLISTALPATLLTQMPAEKAIGMLNLHFDPEALPNLVDSLHVRGRVESMLFDKGVSLETFIHAFKGTLLASLLLPDSGKPAFFIAADLRDPASFTSWANHLKWLTLPPDAVTNTGRVNSRISCGRHLPVYMLQDHLIVLGPSVSRIKPWFTPINLAAADSSDTIHISAATYHSPYDKVAPPGYPDPFAFKESPLNAWLDFKPLTAWLQKNPGDKTRSLISITSLFDRLTFTAGQLNGYGQLETRLEIKMANPTENSLRSLFQLFQ